MADPIIPKEIAARIVSPAAYAEQSSLCADLCWLRENNPLGLVETDGFDPFWLVTRHEDVARMSRDNALFVNSERPSVLISHDAERAMRARTDRPFLLQLLINMDGPGHTKHRRVIQNWFTPARLKQLETEIRGIAKASVDHLASCGPYCDFVKDLALRYPLRVLMGVIGIPSEDEDFLLKMTQEIFGAADKDLSRNASSADDGVERLKAQAAAFVDIQSYFGRLTKSRKRKPTDDLATSIAEARVDGVALSDDEAFALYLIVATAGHDTTSSSTAGAIWGFCESEGEFDKVRSDPSLVSNLIEEAIRWSNPVAHFMRSTSRLVTMRGREIGAGEWLMMSYLSANRDEAVFRDPERFIVDRDASAQIAFGSGAHACIGQHLARLEMRILFEELVPRMAHVGFAGTPVRSTSSFVGGPKVLPIKIVMA